MHIRTDQIDLKRAPEQFDAILDSIPNDVEPYTDIALCSEYAAQLAVEAKSEKQASKAVGTRENERQESNMDLVEQLKLPAKGVHPQTGEELDEHSVANTVEGIRILFSLADELDGPHNASNAKVKLTPEQRRKSNIAEGRAPRSHFPWDDEERQKLEDGFERGESINQLAKQLERSKYAVAVQLNKLNLISDDEADELRPIDRPKAASPTPVQSNDDEEIIPF